MSDQTWLIILLIPMLVAFAFGVWAGLGFPGLYEKYESTGRASRRTPFERVVDWMVERLDR